MRRDGQTPLTRLGRGLAVLVLCAWSLGPILLVVMNSFRLEREIFAPLTRFAFTPNLGNYRALFSNYPGFLDNMANSLVVAIGATVLAVITSTLAGYVYSRRRGRLLAASAFFSILIRLIPPIVVSLPLFPMADWLGLSDTHTILIILYSSFWVSMLTIMMKTLIDQIPVSLDEAALVDGAGPWRVFLRIILPISTTGMIAGAVFVFVYAWNEYLFAFIFTTTRAVTAPLIVANIMDSVSGTEWGVLFAAAVLQLLPVLVLVTVARRFLVTGLMAGSVKG